MGSKCVHYLDNSVYWVV